jgi:hypothetical protein
VLPVNTAVLVFLENIESTEIRFERNHYIFAKNV